MKHQPGSTTIKVFTKKLVKQEKMPNGIIAGFFGYISELDNYQFYQNTTKGFELTDANFKIKFPFKRTVCPVFLMNYCPIIPTKQSKVQYSSFDTF